ncbi:hypothetical protein F4861DRAFT_540901 [Xylaria intraflava]|nr:hypothetical protein F4861DRAFT_540901 [Xylaria intraflava]
MAVPAPSFAPYRYMPPEETPGCIDAGNRSPRDGSCRITAASGHDAKCSPNSWPPLPPSPERQSQTAGTESVVRKRLEPKTERPAAARAAEDKLESGIGAGNRALVLPLRQAKRVRAPHDVDGPGTDKLSVKKQRLLLRLVTSRLSRPFSLPATHILIRERVDTMPVLHRIQQLGPFGGVGVGAGAGAGVGRARRAGHQSALVRKAAILNRIRICVRQAAVSRGHAMMAELAARGTALSHGLQLVTTEARFPATGADGCASSSHGAALQRRPYTTSLHSNRSHDNDSHHGVDAMNRFDARHRERSGTDMRGGHTDTAANTHDRKDLSSGPTPVPPRAPPATPVVPPADASDEEDNTAFPAASFHDRYADLSEDDMDDVYADFGVLFGSPGPRPTEGKAGSPGPVEEQFVEEYLDELDGIPWVV